MPSVLNMLGLEESGFNLVFVIPVAAVLVAVNFLFKFRVRKPEITKKSQSPKKQKVNSKLKGEKTNSEKKGKVKDEKKELASSAKDLEVTIDTVKTKPNKKQLSNEKSPKKNSQTKKQQVDIKNPPLSSPTKAKKSEKLPKNLINKEEGGEWQMVVKKKQKKSDEPLELVTSNISGKKSPDKSNKNLNNKKKANVVKENNVSSTIESDEANSAEIIELTSPKPLLQEQENNCSLFTVSTAIPEAIATENVALAASNADNTLNTKNVPTANVAFDELGDDAWTNTKPQKKNKKKALRE